MYELYPYFTNDSTVGLFSRQDDDIYHSTYGALSESWQKFIIPSGLQKYLQEHESVKILDICYGIGYNTKTSLNVFINNFLKQKEISKKNNKNNKNFTPDFANNPSQLHPCIAAIDTNNLSKNKKVKSHGKNLHAFSHLVPINIAEIDTDNVQIENEGIYCTNYNINPALGSDFDPNENSDMDAYTNFGQDSIYNTNYYYAVSPQNISCNNILIDAVDLDKTLIYLSPFIADASRFNFLFKKDYEISSLNKYKYQQIQNIKNFKKFIRKDFRLCKEVSIILFKKLFESNRDFFNDAILQTILNHKKYSPFISKFMVNFAKFYQNRTSNNKQKKNKSTFLHNIYYRYVSRSYKNVKNLLKNCKIKVNLHKNDARNFIRSTNTAYNFIFLDAFTPAKCPVLWTLQFLNELYYKLEDDGMILTYSNSAAIRNAFLLNGFCVGKIYDAELKKFTGTIATKNKFLIEHPLDDGDIELINSKAGICYRDEHLDLDNISILDNRKIEVRESNLRSSSQVLKHR